MNKQVQLFLSSDDELELSAALLTVRPRLVFVDDSVWPSPVPVLASSIAACKSHWVFLWDQGLLESLPYLVRKDGQFEGPQNAMVIELSRSTPKDNLLLSGRIAQSVGGSDAKLVAGMKLFVADVWEVLKKMTKQPIVAVNPETRQVYRDPVPEYRAGDHAIAWALSDSAHFFRDRSTHNFFKPKT